MSWLLHRETGVTVWAGPSEKQRYQPPQPRRSPLGDRGSARVRYRSPLLLLPPLPPDCFSPIYSDCMFSHTASLCVFTSAELRRTWTAGFSSILTPSSAAPWAAWWVSPTRSVPTITTTTTSTFTSSRADTSCSPRPPYPSL